MIQVALLGLGAVFAALFLVGLALPPPDPIAALKREYLRLSRLPRAQALAELDDRVERLTERHPGKTYAWYLDWLVTDLKRAKRT